jgi:hypothetical protein
MPDPSEHCLNESDCLDTVETSRRDFMKRGLAAMGGLAALSLAEVDEAHGEVKAPGLGADPKDRMMRRTGHRFAPCSILNRA